QFIPLTGHASSPPAGSAPAGVTFSQGLFDFTTTNCTGSVTFIVTYPAALAAGTQYWKYGPPPAPPAPHWYVLPATIVGNVASFTIADGGLGDDDLTVNGAIVDQGGPGTPPSVPTMSEWMLLLLAVLLAGAGAYTLKRRTGTA